MHTVMRIYNGAPQLANELAARGNEVKNLISTVPGFIAYYLVRTDEGAVSITVCDTLAGCDESTSRAADWLRTNLPNLKMNPPQVLSGELALRFANYNTASV